MTASFCSAIRAFVRCVTPCIFTVLLAVAASPATYPGTNTGAIPNGSGNSTCGAPLDVQFAVTGASAPVNSVVVEMTANHLYVGDLDVALIAPDATSFTLFRFAGRTSPTDRGFWTNLNGTYTFSDIGSSPFWAAAAASPGNGYEIPGGFYRAQAGGPFTPVNPGPSLTQINTAFSGVSDPNGVWTLRVLDCAGGGAQGDTGSVTSANLTLGGLAPTSAGVTIAGQIRTSVGRSVSNVRVEMTGGELTQPVHALTNGFGYFSFRDVPAGQTYILTVSSKQHVFANPTRVVNLDDDIFGVDFIAETVLFRR
jgi:subtilisin-like proprotein convertase family protein